jgi:ergothioneine biosynthesis protein EgtB
VNGSTAVASGEIVRAGAATSDNSAAAELLTRFREVRDFTHELCQPLQPEDCVVQSMPDVSPAKWHLAHTSWFFESFVLKPWLPAYRSEVPEYAYLFNSYYNAAGDMHRRDLRGLISRPTVDETYRFRRTIDESVAELLDSADAETFAAIAPVMTLGLHHEQQHQELLVTDIKHVFAQNPLHPVYISKRAESRGDIPPQDFIEIDEAVIEIGHDGSGFSYDNEGPRHRALVLPFALANRPITNAEYIDFIEDDGYSRSEFWLSLGWTTVNEQRWNAPLYWTQRDGAWWNFTLSGFRRVNPDEPVTHISYFEADAFANWAGARLPTEFEWERATNELPIEGNFVDSRNFHPAPAANRPGFQQMFGDVWQWTRSSYSPYPGYRAAPGALGEYNGKFMCNQYVLRGASCATSRTHIRRTYRNFFQPEKRWQFTGIRLARDLR